MKDNIRCPYCKSKKLQIIGASIKDGYMCWKSETEYKCLNNKNHIFKIVKYNKLK